MHPPHVDALTSTASAAPLAPCPHLQSSWYNKALTPVYSLHTRSSQQVHYRLQLAETDKALRVLLALVRHGELCACGEGEELYRRPPRHVTRRVATPPHRRRSRRANLRVREMRNGGQERGDMEVTGKR